MYSHRIRINGKYVFKKFILHPHIASHCSRVLDTAKRGLPNRFSEFQQNWQRWERWWRSHYYFFFFLVYETTAKHGMYWLCAPLQVICSLTWEQRESISLDWITIRNVYMKSIFDTVMTDEREKKKWNFEIGNNINTNSSSDVNGRNTERRRNKWSWIIPCGTEICSDTHTHMAHTRILHSMLVQLNWNNEIHTERRWTRTWVSETCCENRMALTAVMMGKKRCGRTRTKRKGSTELYRVFKSTKKRIPLNIFRHFLTNRNRFNVVPSFIFIFTEILTEYL